MVRDPIYPAAWKSALQGRQEVIICIVGAKHILVIKDPQSSKIVVRNYNWRGTIGNVVKLTQSFDHSDNPIKPSELCTLGLQKCADTSWLTPMITDEWWASSVIMNADVPIESLRDPSLTQIRWELTSPAAIPFNDPCMIWCWTCHRWLGGKAMIYSKKEETSEVGKGMATVGAKLSRKMKGEFRLV
jgi:hypothetical protein